MRYTAMGYGLPNVVEWGLAYADMIHGMSLRVNLQNLAMETRRRKARLRLNPPANVGILGSQWHKFALSPVNGGAGAGRLTG